MTQAISLDLEVVRRQFPALAGDWIFFDNAGGSQILQPVVDRLQDYLLSSNVQLGASYEVSQRASDRVAQGTQAMATYINAASAAEVVLGASTSLLLRILALCLVQTWQSGDEVIVTTCDHEANISAWVELERWGIQLRWWHVQPDTGELALEDLVPLLTARTRLVAMTHVSNVVGTIHPIRAIADLVHQSKALLCVDGVAYAPHRLVDVQAWDVDFYAFSLYKVYGPHQALLYGKGDLLRSLPRFNHYFIELDDIPYKLQPGSVNYEMTYSVLGICDYFSQLAQHHFGIQAAPNLRGQLAQVFELIHTHEVNLGDRLLSYLTTQPKIRVIGQPHMSSTRVPTIAFVVEGVDSATIPPQVDPHRIGIRFGDFYAKRLIEALGLVAQQGVIRVSLVHYNRLTEVDRLIQVLDRVFAATIS